jgi:hypothetical protein
MPPWSAGKLRNSILTNPDQCDDKQAVSRQQRLFLTRKTGGTGEASAPATVTG